MVLRMLVLRNKMGQIGIVKGSPRAVGEGIFPQGKPNALGV